MMFGTLFAQLGLTKPFHETLDKRQCTLHANALTSKWMMALKYHHVCERYVAVLQVMYDASGVRLHAEAGHCPEYHNQPVAS